jgi:TonB family protein
MTKKTPYVVDYGKPKKKSFGFFRLLLLVLLGVFAYLFFIDQSVFDKYFSSTDTSLETKILNQDRLLTQRKTEIALLNEENKNIKKKLGDSYIDIDRLKASDTKNITEIKSLEKQLKYLNELYNAVKKENEILLGINTLTPPSIELDPITVEDKNEFIPIPKTNTNNKATNGDSSAPKLLSKISPKYPSRALQRNLSGSVTVIFDVDKEGNTKNIRIFKSSSSLFENEAKRVVRISKYRPAIDSSGKPIDFYDLKKTYEFNLE